MSSKKIGKRHGNYGSKNLALFEVATIILSTIAFTYLVAMTVPSVSALVPPGQCVVIDKGTSTASYWQMGNNNMLSCVTGYCNPPTSSVYNENDFCVKWLGCGTVDAGAHCSSICTQQSDGSWTVKPTALGDCPAAPPSNNPGNSGGGNSITQLAQTGSGVVSTATNPAVTRAAGNAINAVGGALGIGGSSATSAALTAGGVTTDAQAIAGYNKLTQTVLTTKPFGELTGLRWLFETHFYKGLSVGNIITTAGVAIGLGYATQWAFGKLGANSEFSHAAGLGVGVGYAAGQIASKLGLHLLGLGSTGIGIAVGVVVFLATWNSVRYHTYTFTCYPWTAATGGQDCAKCNSGPLPCTEYSCRSLGQGCQLVNQGTGQELCVWNNSRDVTPPIMQPWSEVLTLGYKYTPNNAISPPNNGVRIVPLNNNTGCINSSSTLTFGVTTDKPAICKWDTDSSLNFSSMNNFFGGSPVAVYNHSQTMTQLPNANELAGENATLENGNSYSVYASCQNVNGVADVGNFVFQFCINPSPDTEAPLIETASIINGSPITYNTQSANMSIYVKDSYPVNCKWSTTDQDYSTMENSFNCPESVVQVNGQGLYQCSTELTGLMNSQDNLFYFRCQYTSPQKNANSQSYAYDLIGTQPLVINSVGPNGTIMNSTNVMKVTLTATTSAGYNQGGSQCAFSPTGAKGSYDTFFSDAGGFDNYQHSQTLNLVPGNYQYYIQCTDLGGNQATNMTNFTVESDTTAPIVVSAYHDGNNLDIVTDENSTCVYSTKDSLGCTYQFSDGQAMQSMQGNINQVGWDSTKTFYVKCMDNFGNQPLPNECSIIASPYSLSNSGQ